MDWFRAVLRESHLALMTKDSILRLQKFRPSQERRAATDDLLESFLSDSAIRLNAFDELTANLKRIIFCVDLQDNSLTHGIRHVMKTDFPHFNYVHGPSGFRERPFDQPDRSARWAPECACSQDVRRARMAVFERSGSGEISSRHPISVQDVSRKERLT